MSSKDDLMDTVTACRWLNTNRVTEITSKAEATVLINNSKLTESQKACAYKLYLEWVFVNSRLPNKVMV